MSRVGSIGIDTGAHHIVIRDNEFSGNLVSKGGRVAIDGIPTTQIVIFRNSLHDVGDVNDTGDQDANPIAISRGHQLWIMENTITRYSGSGVQLNAGFNNNAELHHVYVGRNHIFGGKQTAVSSKTATDVVISSNLFHDFGPSSSSPGACQHSQYGPSRLWIIANTMYNCAAGVMQASTSGLGNGTDLYVVGNLFYNVSGECVNLYSNSVPNRHVVGNTCVGATGGINLGSSASGTIAIQNNIFASITGAHLNVSSGTVATASGSSAHHNVFAGTLRVIWGGSTFTTLSAWQSATGRGASSHVGDPRFVNAATGDYTLQASSPAVDTGIADPQGVYSRFETLYGLSIRGSRPQGGGWDVGAFESGWTATSLPRAPTNLRIVPQ
jgi:hypothetical protein